MRGHSQPPLSGNVWAWWCVDFKVGDRCRAQYGEDGDELWWDGRLLAVHAAKRTVDVLYDDGDYEEDKPWMQVRVRRAVYRPEGPPPRATSVNLNSDSDDVSDADEEAEAGVVGPPQHPAAEAAPAQGLRAAARKRGREEAQARKQEREDRRAALRLQREWNYGAPRARAPTALLANEPPRPQWAGKKQKAAA